HDWITHCIITDPQAFLARTRRWRNDDLVLSAGRCAGCRRSRDRRGGAGSCGAALRDRDRGADYEKSCCKYEIRFHAEPPLTSSSQQNARRIVPPARRVVIVPNKDETRQIVPMHRRYAC